MDKNLIQRTVSGLVYVFVIFLCTTSFGADWLSGIFPGIKQHYLFYGLITFFVIVCIYECMTIMKFADGWEKYAVFPICALIYYTASKRFFNHDFYFNFRIYEILAIALIAIAVVTLFRFAKELYFDNGKLIFTVIYVAIPFCLTLGLPKYSSHEARFTLEVFFLFLLIWCSDTFAYLTGKFFGKHKMAPKISPKKTWEGYFGGVILTLVVGYFIEKYQPELRGNWMVVGFLVSAFAPVGDLVESQLKRSFGVKDSGKIIPGHGGLLDRLDSFIICVPVVYLYFIVDKFI